MTRTAIVLFNLGGPDRPEAIQPFLFNLFNDPAIIGAPLLIRFLLARLISRRRAPVAAEIYAKMGGASPILPNTEAQARALEAALGDLGDVRCFVAMRYWQPRAAETALAVKDFQPDRIILLPLYPQYSETTSGSSLKEWARMAKQVGLTAPVTCICCYPRQAGFITAMVDLIRPAYAQACAGGQKPRLVFSAHGLPKKIIARGDPYQWQVEQTAAAVVAALDIQNLDWLVAYQSRVGPLEWIGPATDAEIRRAGADGVPLVLCPVAFVSEHSETLVELDIEYAELAHEVGVPAYFRVPTVATHPAFIAGLAETVRGGLNRGPGLACDSRVCICPPTATRCAMKTS